MSKGYWVTWYHSIADPLAHARYAELAGPAIEAFGPAYQAALAVLRGKAEREVRILEGSQFPTGGQGS
jgi:uncharacterized protein (DUF1330 family)